MYCLRCLSPKAFKSLPEDEQMRFGEAHLILEDCIGETAEYAVILQDFPNHPSRRHSYVTYRLQSIGLVKALQNCFRSFHRGGGVFRTASSKPPVTTCQPRQGRSAFRPLRIESTSSGMGTFRCSFLHASGMRFAPRLYSALTMSMGL